MVDGISPHYNVSKQHAVVRIVLTPVMQLTPARLYSLCVWARTNRSTTSEELVRTYLRACNASGDLPFRYHSITHSPTVARQHSPHRAIIGPAWRRLCLHSMQPTAPTPVMLALDIIGTVRFAEIHLDDVEVSYHDLDPGWGLPERVDARIEAHRKRDVHVVFVRADGTGLPPGSLVKLSVTLQQHNFLFGAAVDFGDSRNGGPQVQEDRRWLVGALRDGGFNALTPAFALFWENFEMFRGNPWLGRRLMGEFLNMSQACGVRHVHGHNLEWDHPLYHTHWSRLQGCGEYREFLRQRVQRDVSYFRGRIPSYDVINEPFTKRRYLTACPGALDTLVPDAFRWAAAADPSAQLCINEPNVLGGNDNRLLQAMAMVRQFQAEGVPIHCIGLQAYIKPRFTTPERTALELDLLADLGLPLQISEFAFRNLGTVSTLSEAEQADLYAQWMSLWFSHPAVTGMFMWGIWDTQVYIRNSGLYYTNKTAKAAAAAVRQLLTERWNTTLLTGAAQLRDAGNAGFAFRGFCGTYRYRAVVADGRVFEGTFEVPAAGATACSPGKAGEAAHGGTAARRPAPVDRAGPPRAHRVWVVLPEG